jgi:hypothetical protein
MPRPQPAKRAPRISTRTNATTMAPTVERAPTISSTTRPRAIIPAVLTLRCIGIGYCVVRLTVRGQRPECEQREHPVRCTARLDAGSRVAHHSERFAVDDPESLHH